MQQLLADGVKWVDLRLAFTFRYFREGQEVPEPSYDRMFKVFGEEIENFKASEEGKGFWGVRMIWTGLYRYTSMISPTLTMNSGLRVLETRKIVEDMDACLTIKVSRPFNWN